MGIIENLFIELKKHKRRFNLLLFPLIIVLEIAFIMGNYGGQRGSADGWMILFYIIPIINCLFFPVTIAGFASRLMDIEHKGEMLKCLYTFTTVSWSVRYTLPLLPSPMTSQPSTDTVR